MSPEEWMASLDNPSEDIVVALITLCGMALGLLDEPGREVLERGIRSLEYVHDTLAGVEFACGEMGLTDMMKATRRLEVAMAAGAGAAVTSDAAVALLSSVSSATAKVEAFAERYG